MPGPRDPLDEVLTAMMLLILCAALATLRAPPSAADFVARALVMLQPITWIAADRFLFASLQVHLLGWPTFLAPDGRGAALRPAAPPA